MGLFSQFCVWLVLDRPWQPVSFHLCPNLRHIVSEHDDVVLLAVDVSDMVRARGEVLVSRAKATTEYLGKLVTEGAKNAQDNFAKVYSKTA